MSAPVPVSNRGGRRRSHQVALVLLGTAGVIGLAAVYDAWRRAAADDAEGSAAASPPPITGDRVYANNDYVPGVGYYHAPYHGWFAHPYNFHDPARGYFAGGLWQALPWVAALSQSQPDRAAVAAAREAQRRWQEEQPSRTGGSSFASGGYHGGGASSAHPATPAPSAPRPGILRGGFGFSAHPSGG